MTAIQDAIRYEIEQVPGAGETLDLLANIKWLRMPLPFSLSHINLWLVRDRAGWATVDTGLFTKDSAKAWHRTIEEQLDGQPPTRVIVTHMHPDHVGMAGWLCERFGIELWMTHGEYYTCRVLSADVDQLAPDAGVSFYTAAGFDEPALGRYAKMYGMFGKAVSPMPLAFRRMRAGDRLVIGEHEFEILIGNGHSPEHACLFCAGLNVMISGDQILPTISSNVSVWPTEPHANPLDHWLTSCRRLKTQLPDDVLVLPAHGKPFRGAGVRLDALIAEHEAGLSALLDLCAQPKRATDVFPALFKARISESNIIMATGEAIAHLNYLAMQGEIEVHRDSDGVDWYRRR